MFQNWNKIFGLHKLIGFDSRSIEDFAVVDAVDILVGVMAVNGNIQKMCRVEVVSIDFLAFDGKFSFLINRSSHSLCAFKRQPGCRNFVLVPAGLSPHHGQRFMAASGKYGDGEVVIFLHESEGEARVANGDKGKGFAPHCTQRAPSNGHSVIILAVKIACGQQRPLVMEKVVRSNDKFTDFNWYSVHVVSFLRKNSTISEFKKGLSIIGGMQSKEPTPQPKTAKPSTGRVRRVFTALSDWFARNKWARTLLTALMIIIPVYYLGRSLWDNWQILASSDIELDWGRIALSLGILMVAFALYPSGSLIGLRGLGARINYGETYYGYHASQLGKYLPGRIWIIPGRAMTLRRFGVDAVTAAASTLIDMYVLIAAGVLVYIPAMLVTQQETMRQLGAVGLVLCLPLIVSIFFPSLLNRLFSLGMKWIGRGEVTFHFAWYHFALMLLNYLLLWIISGFGLYLLADSISPLTLAQLPIVVGAMGFSWVLGTLSFLTPAGLGVREGVMGVLLAGILPAPLPALVAILSRFWWSLADFGSIGLAFLAFGLWGKKE